MADFSRNLGLLTERQQEALHAARVVVCGVGGMGGVAAEALVRMGVGGIAIVDHDRYEPSNVNRHLHCTQTTLGRPKVEVVGERLREINPGLLLETYSRLDAGNVERVVAAGDPIVNGMDCLRSSLLLERAARRHSRTIVDAWLTPYASVFVMTPQAPHWEEFLGFPTAAKDLDAITEDDINECLRREVTFTLRQFDPLSIVSPNLVEEVLEDRRPRPSLVPVVWLSGVLMANEVMKLLTGQGRIATFWGVFYNQYEHEVRYLQGERGEP